MNKEQNITQRQKEIFEDIADIGISQTVKSLSKITGRNWHIYNKRTEFYDLEKSWKIFPFDDSMKFGGELVFKGEIPMSFLCVFPQKSVKSLTQYINAQVDLQSSQKPKLQEMTVAEVSNILSNSFLGVIANELKMSMLIATPNVSVGSDGYLLKKAVSKAGLKSGYVLANTLTIQSENLIMTTMFVVVISEQSLKTLVSKIDSLKTSKKKDFRMF